ncbi:MAG: heme-binding domain-containing protein [Saprospiraceae bacterium]
MKLPLKKIGMGLVALLLLAQLIPVDRSVESLPAEQDFLTSVDAPAPMAELIRSACYDCHSHETAYPWYAKIAPFSFLIQNHIKEGRQNLNFSAWGSYPEGKATHKLEECSEEVAEGKMPMKSYTWMHAEARMSEAQADALAQWFQQLYRSRQ